MMGGAICCDAALVSPLSRDGLPRRGAATLYTGWGRPECGRMRQNNGANGNPEFAQGGAQTLYVLGCGVGGTPL